MRRSLQDRPKTMTFLMSVGLPYILGQTSIYVYGAVEDEMNNLRVVEIIHFGNKKRPSRKNLIAA